MVAIVDERTRQRRIRRRKRLFFVRDLIIGAISWVKDFITFKKAIIIFCIYYIVRFIDWLKGTYQAGGYFPEQVATVIITAFIVELGLTALISIKGRDDKDQDQGGSHYG